jgi:hypothetical protein
MYIFNIRKQERILGTYPAQSIIRVTPSQEYWNHAVNAIQMA